MIKHIQSIFLIVVVGFLGLNGYAQEERILQSGDTITVTLHDESIIVGVLISQDQKIIVIESESLGTLEFLRSDIKTVSQGNQTQILVWENKNNRNYQYWRNYLTETAISIGKGKIYYNNIWLGVHTFSFGISDILSVTAGTEIFTLLEGNSPILLISPKLTIPTTPKEELHFGLGVNALYVTSRVIGTEFFGSIYGITTIGNHDNNFTAGIGLAFSEKEFADGYFLQLGGMTRIGKRLMLVVDNVLYTGGFVNYGGSSFNLRFLMRKWNFELGLATDYRYGVLPVAGFTIPLTR